MSTSSGDKTIYGVPNSGWTSPSWNWGYARGTGHDCASICREIYSNERSREVLVNDLLTASGQPENFEEVKLVLGLKFQSGKWDGTDGGVGGYGVVLTHLAEAQRYEVGSEEQCYKNFIKDMHARFHLLGPSPEDQALMDQQLEETNLDAARRRCSGLVLKATRFLEYGL